ncbi:VanZ family protein [Paenibacillus sp. FSL K6-1230]|uniref:VanZ family protein n=1 Tax=Paenibacillus sp. FSL K6-1230 TaxID=2921603 RepID=UPI00039EC338
MSKLIRSNIFLYLFYLLFCGYVATAIYIILFKTVPITALITGSSISLRSVNWIPGYTVISFVQGNMDVSSLLKNVLGNVAIFIPLGIFLSYIPRFVTLRTKLILIAVSSCALEFIQYAFGLGSTDIDDVILNSIGGLIGVWIYKRISRMSRTKEQLLVSLVTVFMLCGLGGGATIWWTDSGLIPFLQTQTEYIDVNKEVLGGIEENSADLFGDLIQLNTTNLTVLNNPQYATVMSSAPDDKQLQEAERTVSYNSSTQIIFKQVSSERNKVTSQYKKGTASELMDKLKEAEPSTRVRVWLSKPDGDTAVMILVSQDY